jgi:hypothetical protein
MMLWGDLPTQAELHELLCYIPETGKFIWRNPRWPSHKLTGCAGCNTGRYIVIRVNGITYRAHRLAWYYVYGSMPDGQLDHINGDKTDNRICNLRLATPAENISNRGLQYNNSSGYKGVTRLKSGRWSANIRNDGCRNHLGTFDTAEQAHAAYCEAARDLHGEFANTGVRKRGAA